MAVKGPSKIIPRVTCDFLLFVSWLVFVWRGCFGKILFFLRWVSSLSLGGLFSGTDGNFPAVANYRFHPMPYRNKAASSLRNFIGKRYLGSLYSLLSQLLEVQYPGREKEHHLLRQTRALIIRPSQTKKFVSREYVQPQWVYDSVNALLLLPAKSYTVGRVPPPHLSPFVDNDAEGYLPEYAETIKRLQAAARNQVIPMPGVGFEDLAGPQPLLVEGVIDRAEAIEAAEQQKRMRGELQGTQNSSISNAIEQDTVEEGQTGNDKVAEGDTGKQSLDQVAEDDENMSLVKMSGKKRKIYDAMLMAIEKKRDGVERLKKQIEAAKK